MRKDDTDDKGIEAQPPRRSGARSPIRVSSASAMLTRAIAGRQGLDTLSVATRWRDVVGPNLARHTQIVSITRPKSKSGGCLTIKTDGGAALLVQHQSREILQRVNAVLGAGAIVTLKTVQGVIKAEVTAPKPKPPRLTGAEEEAVRQSVATVEDTELRDRLTRLMRQAVDSANRR